MSKQSADYHRRWRAKNKDRAREAVDRYRASEKGKATERARYLAKNYGLTVERYDALLFAQAERCGICRELLGEDVCIDHDHETGEVRGLLHRTCNAALGGFRDDYRLVQLAALYLHRTTKSVVHPWAAIGSPPEHRDWKPGMFTFEPLIDPTARINAFVTVDAGMFRRTEVGARTFLMVKSHVGHDALIGMECEIAPLTSVGGEVEIGNGVKVGQGATFKPRVKVGDDAVIGMGAVVTKDVPAGETWAGNPARNIQAARCERVGCVFSMDTGRCIHCGRQVA